MRKPPVDELVDQNSLHHHYKGLPCCFTVPRCRCPARPSTPQSSIRAAQVRVGMGHFGARRIVSGRIAEIYRSARLGAAVGSIGEVRAPEISTLDVGAIKPGIVHLGVFSAGPLQVGVAEIAVQEVGVVQVSVLKMATVSVDVEEISV